MSGRAANERVNGHTYPRMQATLWCLDNEDSLEDALIRIVNAGGDTNTSTAVAGGVRGARFGASAIPQQRLDCVSHQKEISVITSNLIEPMSNQQQFTLLAENIRTK